MNRSTILSLLGIISSILFIGHSSFAYNVYRCNGNEAHNWNSNSIRVRASRTSFPSGHVYTQELQDVINHLNNNPSNFSLNLTFESGVSNGNGQNETWFSDSLDPPAVARYWYYCGDNPRMAEVDVIFDNRLNWTISYLKRFMDVYGGSSRPWANTAMHEFGHFFGMAHEGNEYNIMGQDWDHIDTNGSRADAYFGEDASQAAVVLYGTNNSRGEDVGVSHWRWIGSNGGYSRHGRTRVFDSSGQNRLRRVMNNGEPHYLVDNGQNIRAEFSFENIGVSTQSVDVGFYLSTNDVISTADQLLNSRNFGLTRDDVWTRKFSVTLPNNLSPNTNYWIGAIVDNTNSISEWNEGNNATYIGLRTKNFALPTPTNTPTPTDTPTPTNTPTQTPTLGPIITPTEPPIIPTPPILPTLPPIEDILDFGRVGIFDQLTGMKNKVGQTLFDPADDRSLTIRWNGDTTNATDWHIYVRQGLGGFRYLGRTAEGNTNSFTWEKTESTDIAADFRNGPDFNSVYTFVVVRIDDQLTNDDLFPLGNAIGYNLKGANQVSLALAEFPHLLSKKVAVYDDILGGDNLAPKGEEGSDTDPAESRAIQLAWDFEVEEGTVQEYHVMVRVNGGEFEFLGQTGVGTINYFWWTSKDKFRTAEKFRDGPQDGNTYQFEVVLIPYSGDLQSMKTGTLDYSV
ncbi:hypothetical protein GF373_03040, partial [bacterium]|nr:hypothetical protein [bacterium]